MIFERNYEFERATRLIDMGYAQDALDIAERFLAKSDDVSLIAGHLCRGIVYEEGGDGVERNLEKSLENFRRVSLISPCSAAFVNLARVSMKRSGGHPDARHFLNIALDYPLIPEAVLCLAEYYETNVEPDLESARKCHIKAARMWRLAGFRGYSRVCRRMGLRRQALAMDLLRMFITPVLLLLIGSRARVTF
jgi:hypothetical protein